MTAVQLNRPAEVPQQPVATTAAATQLPLPKRTTNLWIVVPALNEAENLPVVVPGMINEMLLLDVEGHVLVVDDGSTDKTREVAADLAERIPGVELISLGRNQGKATALKHGFERAVAEGADVIAMMDADGQDDPAELGLLLARLADGADLVTGARNHDRKERFVKRVTSRLYNGVTRRLSGTPGKDFNSGFKVMRAEVAANVTPMMYGELHRYLTVIAHWQGFRTAEVAVHHHERLHGKSKYGLARFWRGFVDLVTVRFLMTYESRPSHLFSGLGLASFAAGGLALGYLFVQKLSGEAVGGRPLLIAGVVLALGGLQLVLFGLVAELLVYSRNRERT